MTDSSTAISSAVFEEAFLVAGDRVAAAKDELCTLDAHAGDGDLGATLATGFRYVRENLEDDPAVGDIGTLLVRAGSELARKAPSTIGTLLATAFLRAGACLGAVAEAEAGDIASALQAAAAGVAERGGAQAGQRTILDAMLASAEAAAATAGHGGHARATLEAAAAAAREGADATAGMEPQLGRAGWVKDRARGVPDAGAVAWSIFMSAFAERCTTAEAEASIRDA